MKKNKILAYSLITLSLLTTFTGCSPDDTSSVTSTTSDVTVERGPILDSVVYDDNGQKAISIGNGVYRFKSTPTYPIKAIGGYIDVDRDGKVSAGDVQNNLYLKSGLKGNVVTVASSLSTNKDIVSLFEQFDITLDTLENSTPDDNSIIAAISDEIYAYALENNISDLSSLTSSDLSSLIPSIQNTIEEYKVSGKSISDIESDLMTNLESSGKVHRFTYDEATEIENSIVNNDKYSTGFDDSSFIDTILNMPMSELNDAITADIIKMRDEEQLAKDVYNTLSITYSDTSIFSNISTRSEAKHQEMVETLVKKYNIATSVENDTGIYNNTDFGTLYNTLVNEGSASYIDALKVGCKIEVLDIDDLEKSKSILSDNSDDIEMVYDNLEEGSFKHYDAFDNALKRQGITDGCCSIPDGCLKEEE